MLLVIVAGEGRQVNEHIEYALDDGLRVRLILVTRTEVGVVDDLGEKRSQLRDEVLRHQQRRDVRW